MGSTFNSFATPSQSSPQTSGKPKNTQGTYNMYAQGTSPQYMANNPDTVPVMGSNVAPIPYGPAARPGQRRWGQNYGDYDPNGDVIRQLAGGGFMASGPSGPIAYGAYGRGGTGQSGGGRGYQGYSPRNSRGAANSWNFRPAGSPDRSAPDKLTSQILKNEDGREGKFASLIGLGYSPEEAGALLDGMGTLALGADRSPSRTPAPGSTRAFNSRGEPVTEYKDEYGESITWERYDKMKKEGINPAAYHQQSAGMRNTSYAPGKGPKYPRKFSYQQPR